MKVTNNHQAGLLPDPDFGGCFFQESGLIWVLFEGKWTFLRAFWKKKVDFFTCFQAESGPFCLLFWVKMESWNVFLGKVDHFGKNCGPFWTLGPWGEGTFAPRPQATGLIEYVSVN